MKNIIHENTDEVVCPYCGYRHNESWEYARDHVGDIGEIDCENCGETFEATREVEVTYFTRKLLKNERK